jgi:hypothetical protein
MERFTVTYQGVPIGRIEVPEGRRWVGGWLDPLPAADVIRPVLSRIARQDLAELLISLERDAAVPQRHVPAELREAFERAAELSFELLDEAGLKVPTDLVRIADSGAPRLHVRAYFWRADAPVSARMRRSPIHDGGT